MMHCTSRSSGRGAALALLLALTLGACSSSRPFVDEPFRDWRAATPPERTDLAFRVFLIGDVAPAGDERSAALAALKAQLQEAGEHSAVVFLGDQLRRPMPDSLAASRAEAEAALLQVAEAVEGYPGSVVVLPGDQDWGGADALDRQADFLAAHLGDGVFLPPNGLPGPVDLKLNDDLVLIALNTEWWLRDSDDRPSGDDIATELDVLIELTELLAEHDDQRILVVGHHPVFSNGERGGHYTLRQHLFPLTDLWRPLYVPLPGVGSIYPLLRSTFGGRQDFASEDYREFRAALPHAIEEHDGIVYAAAHEHGLQYFPLRTDALELQHHVVSGGGAQAGPLAGGFGAAFAHPTTGFASLQLYRDGTMWLEFWQPEAEDAQGRLVFRTQLEEPRTVDVDAAVPEIDPATLPDYTDSTRVVRADPRLAAGPVKRFFLGANYRDVWAAPVRVPVLDLGREMGGLAPVKRGGGYQTTSLRMVNPEGQEFVLRQVRKQPDLLLPPGLRGTFAADVLADQLSTSNPYGALVVPRLATAAGIYHTRPAIVVVPDDPRLGVYRETFANSLVLFEERPAGDVSGQPHLSGAEDVDSTPTVLSQLRGDNDVRVDQPFYLRNRLFDLLIGDWDRHQDQWRWAQFEPFELDPTLAGEGRTQGRVYRPIPRDRDQVFFRVTGLLPRIAQFYVPGLQDFDSDYGDVVGLTDNGLFLDRRMLNALTRDEWQAVARDLQARMTDEVLREALRDWPAEVDALHGERIFRTLLSRRDKLTELADTFYELQAGVVDVVGSDKHERFVVNRRSGDETEVTVYKTSKEGENRRVIYHRIFRDDETKEIRLYGLGGRDRFEFEGASGDGPYVRVIGGPGEDTFAGTANGAAPASRRVHYYDTERGNEVARGHARVTLSDDPANNRYDPEDFAYPSWTALPFFGYNEVDGVFLGASAEFVTPKFRRDPYGHAHLLAANVSTFTGAVNARYRGHWVERFGPFDALVELEGATPQDVRNFYGLGNETTSEFGRDFYRVRQASAAAALGLAMRYGPGVELGFAPALQATEVEREAGRVLAELPAAAEVFDDQWFAGGDGFLLLHHADRPVNPRQGFRWENRAGVRTGIRNTGDTFAPLASALSVYLSPRLDPQITLALRVGAAHVAGDFPFYEAATLGGVENLRGYPSTRFSGRSALYQNAELRVQLLNFRTYAASGALGVLGFADNGRVWADGQASKTWHQGYGGGLWANLFDLILVRGTVGASEEGTFVNVGLGFLY